ncbi:hypothetical protein ACYQR9_06285 [Methylobacterium sp. CM6241]
MSEHEKYFEEHGVALSGHPKQEEKEYSHFVIEKSDFPATYEGKPTVLLYLSVVPRPEEERNLLVTDGRSPDGGKEHSDELTKIVKSLGASIDEQ